MEPDEGSNDPLAPVIKAILDGRRPDAPVDPASLNPVDRALLEPLRILAAIAAVPEQIPPEASIQVDERFELLALIGRGASGDVYRAWDSRLHREVALKIVRRDRPFAASFLAEARRLARVRHPNVVAIHDVLESNGEARICLELLSGRTIDEIVKAEGPLSMPAVVALAETVCEALTAIHAAGLVHGDVNGHNVFVENTGRVVLMDLGAGVEIQNAHAPAREGTPIFMAPELLAGGPRQPQSDIFALGVLLFFAATGRYPVIRPMAGEARSRLTCEEAVSAARLQLQPPLSTAVARALAADPADRFSDANAMKRAVRPLPSRWQHPMLAGLAAVVVLLCVVAWRGTLEGARPAAVRTAVVQREIRIPEGFDSPGALTEDGSSMTLLDRAGALHKLSLETGTTQLLVPATASRRVQPSVMFRHTTNTVLYAMRDEACNCTGLFEVRPDGGLPRPVSLRERPPHLWPIEPSADDEHLLAEVTYDSEPGKLRIIDLSTGDHSFEMAIPQDWFGASLSPDGRFIAHNARGPAGDLAVVDTHTRETWPLLTGAPYDTEPLWAPDGSAVVFLSDRAGGYGLWQIAVRDGRPVSAPILLQRDMGRFMPLSISPLGVMLFWRSPVVDIEIAPFDPEAGLVTGPARALSGAVSGSNTAPTWSPSGDLLAYASERKPGGGARSVLVIHHLDDGREREITVPVNGLLEPVWSPDRRFLLVRGPGTLDNVRGARLVHVSSGVVMATFPYPVDRFHQWAPDGKAYFFLGSNGLQKVDIRSGELKSIVTKDAWQARTFALSPDGREIAASASRPGQGAVILFPADGGTARILQTLPKGDRLPEIWGWTPDMKRLIAVRGVKGNSEGLGELVTIRVDDGSVTASGLERPGLTWVRPRPPAAREIAYRTGRDPVEPCG